MEGEVWVLGFTNQPAIDGKAQPGTRLSVAGWRDDVGPVVPFFTSEETLQHSIARREGSERRSVRLGTRDLLEIVRGQRLVLDPDSDYGRTFTPEDVDALLEGRDIGHVQEVIQKEANVLVGAAAHVPPELPRVLAEFFAERPGVRQAHLGWIAYPETDESGYLVVVLADDREAAMDGFGMLQVGDITDGKNVDVHVVPENQTEHWLSNVPPFYKRQSGLGGRLGSLFGRRPS